MLIFTLPLIIMFLAAIIPAIVLLRYIYKKDKLDKEPMGLIVKLVILGIISTVCAALAEQIGIDILGKIFVETSLIYKIVINFFVIGISEEGFKYLVLKRATWKNPEFNCQFDALVYAVAVSLGFALWENIQYVFTYGFSTALIRAVTAVPGHACFGVLMGAWYGLAKKYENTGDEEKAKSLRNKAVIMPALAHGAYDFCAGMGSFLGSILFIAMVAGLFYLCFNLVKGLSDGDQFINNDPDFTYKDIE